ncbi:hypothetical protein COO60DRAFT_1643794 [Scenedesmus sp. NREL 46B-D3]|nr:hypothetical protein COO60DRAFT_1643794 [Scenedesmus sp. NREL 46B-D3]
MFNDVNITSVHARARTSSGYGAIKMTYTGTDSLLTWLSTFPVAVTLVCWSPKLLKLLAMGHLGMFTSTDCVSWTSQAHFSTAVPKALCWSPQLARAVAAFDNAGLCTLCWAAELGQFAAISNTVCATSPDGLTWTTASMPAAGAWRNIVWAAHMNMFAVNNQTSVHMSYDGLTWMPRFSFVPATTAVHCVAIGTHIPGASALTVIGSIEATGSIAASVSDARLKANVVPLVARDAERALSDLAVYRFRWNELGQQVTGIAGDVPDIGMIAQQVQAVLPEVVEPSTAASQQAGLAEGEPAILTVAYDKLVPFAVAAWQAQRRRLEQLEAAAAALETEIT